MKNKNIVYDALDYIKYFEEEKMFYFKITNQHGLELYVKYIKNIKELLFVFYGSNDKQDWKNNFKFTPQFLEKNTYFHRGAYLTLHASKSIIIELIQKLGVEIKKTTILGYSAGGYLAQCLAYELNCCFQFIPLVYIYGSGIILSKDIQRHFLYCNIFIVQIVIDNDIVPKLLRKYYPEIVTMKIRLISTKSCFKIKKNHSLKYYKYLLETYYDQVCAT